MTPHPAVFVATAALKELGRPDLASLVKANRQGMPTHDLDPDLPEADNALMAKAFYLGHLAIGHDDRLTSGGIDCALVSRA